MCVPCKVGRYLAQCSGVYLVSGMVRKGKERKGKERKGKERKGKERKGKERKEETHYESLCHSPPP